MSGRRPEHIAPPEIFYDVGEASKYTQNSRIISIQESMTQRAIELLQLPLNSDCLLLDLGCGSGLSSQVIEENGHRWIGTDISQAMIDVARMKLNEGDLDDLQMVKSDLGDGLPFRPGTFDGAVSISALQWLCNADKKSHSPAKRLYRLFSSLYTCLDRHARAVLQFYPENQHQIDLINQQALRAGFTGGLVIDNPNSTKTKKYFLVLSCGGSAFKLPKAIEEDVPDKTKQIRNESREKPGKIRKRSQMTRREYTLHKKERQRRRGEETRPDTKYTARQRSGRF